MVYVFFLIFFIFVASLFSLNTLFLGGLLLFFCLLIMVVISFVNLTWFGLLFILIYVGGVLVLFFYIFSLNSKPIILDYSPFKLTLFVLFFSVFFLFFVIENYFSLDFVFRNILEDTSSSLFNLKESLFIVLVGVFLLFALFSVKKFTSDVKSAVRPIKF